MPVFVRQYWKRTCVSKYRTDIITACLPGYAMVVIDVCHSDHLKIVM